VYVIGVLHSTLQKIWNDLPPKSVVRLFRTLRSICRTFMSDIRYHFSIKTIALLLVTFYHMCISSS